MQNVQTTEETIRPRQPLRAWFDVRRRRLGSWAFAINRLTGLGLVLYLFLHLAVLSTLLQGEAGWDRFLQLARSPLFLLLDVVLIFGILFHGLNGIRVALVGMGVGARSHRALFVTLMIIGFILLVISAWKVFTL
ncbi:MAG: succinate dehydrogenase, cytochrome b556 subunit [Anaerolineales bacterium]|nr:succinate dehydrogenase, cytochrome b556 subunit [Anaerolineales bacterium]MCB8952753.1 succinate dehydrogenase, cytochrome b556 subunit [Ardenticatenales bacterium]